MPKKLKKKVTSVDDERSKNRSQKDTSEVNESSEKTDTERYVKGVSSTVARREMVGVEAEKDTGEDNVPLKPPGEKSKSSAEKPTPESDTYKGYFAGSSSAAENDETFMSSPNPLQVNLLEKTRIWKHRQLKLTQYEILRQYYLKMEEGGNINWCRKIGKDNSINKSEDFEDPPCDCNQEGKHPILRDNKKACEGEQATTRGSTSEIPGTSTDTPIRLSPRHTIDCRIKYLCLYFSLRAEYFIDEKVDPDLFLYIPLPKGKFRGKVDYKYNILQETRKILILKLVEGLRLIAEAEEKSELKSIQKLRIWKHNVLYKLLEHLVRPYEKNPADSTQKPRKHKDLEISQNKSEYLSLKAEYRNLCEKLKKDNFDRANEELICDAKRDGVYISYESFLELMKNEGKFDTLCRDDELFDHRNGETMEEFRERVYGGGIDDDTESSYHKEYLSYLFSLSIKDSEKLGGKGVNQESKESKCETKEKVKLEPEGKRKNSDQETIKPEKKKKNDEAQADEEPKSKGK